MTKLPIEEISQAPAPRKRKIGPMILLGVIALVALGLFFRLSHRPKASPAGGGGPGGGGPGGGGPGGGGPGGGGFRPQFTVGPQPVAVRSAEIGDLNIYLDALGSVTPLANVTLRAQTTGQLIEVDFTEGQMVKKGDLLAVIDPRPYEVALQQAHGQWVQAQAQLKDAKNNLARYVTLAQQDSISGQQVDSQRALVNQYEGQMEADEAAINSAKLNISYCHVTAPVGGRVGFRQIDPGNYVTPGDANGLVVLTQVRPTTVIFTLSEDSVPEVAGRLHSGAAIPVEAYDRTQTQKLATGALTTIDNQVDATTGTFKLRAVFPNDDETLFPNQFVNVRMLLDVDHGAIIIPTSSIERGQPGTYVYVVKPDNTVTARPVKLGPTEGEQVAVVSGLAQGERVVVDGADKLKEGMAVIIQGAPAPKMAGSSPKPASGK